MPRPSLQDVLNHMTPAERAGRAKAKIKQVVDRISGLLALAESNALIVYSPLLASQIPASTAGHAFNVFQRAMHGFEIVQLCALWDKADHTLAHISIPTVHALIDHDDVVAQLVEDVRAFWPDRKSKETDGDQDMLVAYSIRTRAEEARKVVDAFAELRSSVPSVMGSPLLASVRNMRDRDLAHALETTRAEEKALVAPMRYGDEQELLTKTMTIMESMYLWITGTNFDLEDNRKLQRTRAEALWRHCVFDIAPRS